MFRCMLLLLYTYKEYPDNYNLVDNEFWQLCVIVQWISKLVTSRIIVTGYVLRNAPTDPSAKWRDYIDTKVHKPNKTTYF